MVTRMFACFSFLQRMEYMTSGTGLMIGPGNCYYHSLKKFRILDNFL